METPIEAARFAVDKFDLRGAAPPTDDAGLGHDAEFDAIGLAGFQRAVGTFGEKPAVLGMDDFANPIDVHSGFRIFHSFESGPGVGAADDAGDEIQLPDAEGSGFFGEADALRMSVQFIEGAFIGGDVDFVL